jgi:hypothetical protein
MQSSPVYDEWRDNVALALKRRWIEQGRAQRPSLQLHSCVNIPVEIVRKTFKISISRVFEE